MEKLNIISLLSEHKIFIMFIYLILIIIQLIWLYYEFTFKNITLFFGNKIIIIISLLIWYISPNYFYFIIFYIFWLVNLIKYIEKKYDESFDIFIDNLFLEDILFIVVSVIIVFYLM